MQIVRVFLGPGLHRYSFVAQHYVTKELISIRRDDSFPILGQQLTQSLIRWNQAAFF